MTSFLTINALTTTMTERDFIVFDLETTGRNPLAHEIIEIGAIRVSPDLRAIRGEFNEKITPTHIETAEPEALVVNGYTADTWGGASSLTDSLARFAEFCRDGQLAGYNVAFDWMFLKHALYQYRIELVADYHVFDIMSAVRAVSNYHSPTGTWRLRDVSRMYEIGQQAETHRAIDDATLALAVWKSSRQA